jgi:protein-tyrosine phosphatase
VPAFLDLHSHVVPSGDDGVSSTAEGLELCREAARRGTAVLYGTPHVWPAEGLSTAREQTVREAYEIMAPAASTAGLELRLGFELTPSSALLDEDLDRYALEGLDIPSVLVEFPFTGGLELTRVVAEHAEVCGLRPILAHPERAEAICEAPDRLRAFVERGWPVHVNGSSLTGYHGPEPYELGWSFLELGLATLVGSDGHRPSRPPFLDAAYRAARSRLGDRADALFDGSALAHRDAVDLAQRR